MKTIADVFLEPARKAKSIICRPNLLASEQIKPSATERRRNMLIADNSTNPETKLRVRSRCAGTLSFLVLFAAASSWAQTDSRPSFGDRAIPDQVWTADSEIEPLQLPAASAATARSPIRSAIGRRQDCHLTRPRGPCPAHRQPPGAPLTPIPLPTPTGTRTHAVSPSSLSQT